MNPVEKLKRLMREHGIDKRLQEKKLEGPLAPAPEDERRPDAGTQKPLSEIRGVVAGAKIHERQVTPHEKDDGSSE